MGAQYSSFGFSRTYYAYSSGGSVDTSTPLPVVMYAHGSSGDFSQAMHRYNFFKYASSGGTQLGPFIAVALQAFPTCYIYVFDPYVADPAQACGADGFSLQVSPLLALIEFFLIIVD